MSSSFHMEQKTLVEASCINSAVGSSLLLGGLNFSDTARANDGLARGGDFENSQL